jgi:tRNA-guanine family transglycosylase
VEIQRTIGADIIMAFDECISLRLQLCEALYENDAPFGSLHQPLILYPLNTGTSKLFFLLYKEDTYKDLRHNQQNILPIQPTRKCHRRLSVGNLQRKCML